MNEMKPEDVMRALEICEENKKDCYNCPQWVECVKGEMPFFFSRLLPLLRRYQAENTEKDATIAQYILQIAEMQKQIATQDRILTEFMKRKEIEADKDAEIERLTAKNEFHKSEIEEMSKDRLELHKAIARMKKYDGQWKKDLETAKAEAIDEFAERLKEAVKYIPWCDYPPVHNCIDQIAKEMKEGEGDA